MTALCQFYFNSTLYLFIQFFFDGMMSTKSIVLDLGGFCPKMEFFLIKVLFVCTEDYKECVRFSPASKFKDPTPEQNTFLFAEQRLIWIGRELRKLSVFIAHNLFRALF